MENWFIFEMVQVRASLVFPFTLCCQIHAFPWGKPKRDALLAKIWVMVSKGAVAALPHDPGLGFYCNLFLVMKVAEGVTSW